MGAPRNKDMDRLVDLVMEEARASRRVGERANRRECERATVEERAHRREYERAQWAMCGQFDPHASDNFDPCRLHVSVAYM